MQVVIAQMQLFEVCVVSDLVRDYAAELVVVQQQTLQPLREHESRTVARGFSCRERRYQSCEAVVGQVQRHKARQPAKRSGHGTPQAIVRQVQLLEVC